jgi:glycosyltransferase involved in cell wall biosynthesis
VTRPLRILRVANIPDNRTGGMSRYIHFVSDELRASGHHVEHVFADALQRPGDGRMARFAVPVRVVREVRRRLGGGVHYDVVEVHEPIAAGYAVARLAARSLPPLLASVYALEARGWAARVRYARTRREQVGSRARVGALTVVAQANLALRLADHVCVETTEDAEYLRARFGHGPDRVTMQHGGISPAFFAAPTAPRRGVLFVGTWIERKGVRDLVPALQSVLDRHPDLPVTVAGCGFSADHVRADFPDRLRPRVRVVPRITDDGELAALYHAHAVFVFPSTFEGLPLAVLEAAAAGLGVVTTGVCGMKDTIADGRTGLIVPVGDPARLAAATHRLVADPELAAGLGRAARESVRGYTWRRSAEQFLDACRRAARRSR